MAAAQLRPNSHLTLTLTPPAVGEARLEPPGGLQPARVPQFVLLTHDDALMAKTDTVLRELTEGLAANGCPVTATLFTQVQGTDCELLRKLWEDGFEVADHTGTHQSVSLRLQPCLCLFSRSPGTRATVKHTIIQIMAPASAAEGPGAGRHTGRGGRRPTGLGGLRHSHPIHCRHEGTISGS